MSKIKGAAIRARLEYVRAHHGEAELARVIETLEPMDRVVLTGTLLPSIWYPFQVLANLDGAVQRELGGGDENLFAIAGEDVARQHARSIYKVFFRETDPERILKLAACIFADYYSGAGRLSVRSGTDGRSARLHVEDCATTSRSHCLTTMSYFRTVVEACTGRHAAGREVRCRCWGDDACEFELSWPRPLKAAASA